MTKKRKERIAVAATLNAQRPYCIQIHSTASQNAGVSEEQLAKVTFVAATHRAGGAVTHRRHLISGKS
ncbi:carboxymuconolactone decarboxylase family protein [Hyphobacterium sp.]|uniref:carboxymuconolactone decarboxylase family protein n=1 Tax=Hyphobacterium sp. TaxID=2004662 RepID=UPI003BAD61CE